MKAFLVSLLFISVAWANEALVSNTHVDVYQKTKELSLKYGAKKVLVVFDIDNTLLKAKQDLGSDQWFEWQSEQIKTASQLAVFTKFEDLLAAQAVFFQASSMSLTESALPNIVAALKNDGHKMLLLTSRGPNLRNVTERELLNNQLWFSDSSPMKGVPNEFIEAPFKLNVSFMNGIFMTSGHHKGEALDYLVKKAGNKFSAIVFVDDHLRHTTRVFDTFSIQPNIEVVTFRYSKEDAAVEKFKTGEKVSVNSQANEILSALQKTFK